MGKQMVVSKEKQKALMGALMQESFRKAYEQTLPTTLRKYMCLDTAINIIGRAVQKTPKLLACDYRTIQQALIDSAALGLELAGPLHQAYLVPYYNSSKGVTEAQMQIGYPGYLELMQRSERFDGAPIVQWVFERDQFSLNLLSRREDPMHKPCMDGDRGKPKLVYFMAWFRSGGYHFDFRTYDQIMKHRERYVRKDRYGNWPEPWDDEKNFDAFLEMGRKTIIRLAQKHLPKNTQLAQALDYEAQADQGLTPTIVEWEAPPIEAEAERQPEEKPSSRTDEVKAALKETVPAGDEKKKIHIQDNTEQDKLSFPQILETIDMVGMPSGEFEKACKKSGVNMDTREGMTSQKKLKHLESLIHAWVDQREAEKDGGKK